MNTVVEDWNCVTNNLPVSRQVLRAEEGATMRVLAAMSGGVDSAVAAAQAVDAGHDVTGVHLALSASPQAQRTGARGCCTIEDSHDARRAADVIGIPFYIWGMASEFSEDVVADFVAEYSAGRTPNPCLRCNEKIKFAAVLDRAVALGFDAVATGHHVRLSGGVLRRSVDMGKDQSYVLAVLTQQQLSRAMFPLGELTKQQVRAQARQRGLLVADKPDSHDICFIPDGDTQGFLRRHLGEAKGSIVDDSSGETLGEHDGAFGYTVGQRRGLRLQRPAADGKPRYVLSIEPVSNTVRVGPAQALEVDEVVALGPVWTGGKPIEGPFDCQAQLRAHGEAYPATAELVDIDGGSKQLVVRLHRCASGVAAGQAVVLYRPDPAGDIVLASGTIETANNTAMAAAN